MSATLAPQAAAVATERPLTQRLILARLLVPGAKPPPKSQLVKDLNKLLDDGLASEQFDAAVAQLRAEGLLTEKVLKLTDDGRTAARAFLRVQALPARCNWQALQKKFLVPLALRLDPNAADTAKKIDTEDHLAATMLRTKESLPAGTANTVKGALEALACRELGFPDETCVFRVVEIVLSRLAQCDTTLPGKEINKQVPRLLLNTTRGGVGPLRQAALREWLNGGPAEPTLDMELAEFARTVLALARSSATGRFGGNKMFIRHAWRQFRNEPTLPPYDLDAFKFRLVEANHQGLLTLSRADLVAVMDPDDVRESETHYLNAQYHFILVEQERP